MNPGVAERLTLQAIIVSADPRVSAEERLRAIELLSQAGGSGEDGASWVARWLAGMSDAELAVVMRGYYPLAEEGAAPSDEPLPAASPPAWPRWGLRGRRTDRRALWPR